jgi:phosphoglycolate phosphatase
MFQGGNAMRTVVFDLDGTLADTSADLLAAANACFGALGHTPPLGPDDKLTAFLGGRAMLRLGFDRLGLGWSEADISREYPRLLASYAEVLDRETRLYPGAVQAVQDLRALGFATAICTNKPEGLAVELVKRLGIAPLFGALIGADTFPVRKPDPMPYRAAVERAGGAVARSFLIGDTQTDHDTARAAGVPIVMVSFGPEGQGVARLNPDAVLDHYAHLPALAQKLIS